MTSHPFRNRALFLLLTEALQTFGHSLRYPIYFILGGGLCCVGVVDSVVIPLTGMLHWCQWLFDYVAHGAATVALVVWAVFSGFGLWLLFCLFFVLIFENADSLSIALVPVQQNYQPLFLVAISECQRGLRRKTRLLAQTCRLPTALLGLSSDQRGASAPSFRQRVPQQSIGREGTTTVKSC